MIQRFTHSSSVSEWINVFERIEWMSIYSFSVFSFLIPHYKAWFSICGTADCSVKLVYYCNSGGQIFWFLLRTTIQTLSVLCKPTCRTTLPCQIHEIHTTSLQFLHVPFPCQIFSFEWSQHSQARQSLCPPRCRFTTSLPVWWWSAAVQPDTLRMDWRKT